MCVICEEYKEEILEMISKGMKPSDISKTLFELHNVQVTSGEIRKYIARLQPRDIADRMLDVDKQVAYAEKIVVDLNETEELKAVVLEAKMLRKQAIAGMEAAKSPREVEVYSRLWEAASSQTQRALKMLHEFTKKQNNDDNAKEVVKTLKNLWGAD